MEELLDVEVAHAHPGAHAWVGGRLLDRAEREAALDAALAPGATRPVGAGDRARSEEPDPYRLCFERDLDRVKHSRPWRRLAGKCQVFVAPEDDHLRTRLTHAVEVAQVATGIARAANLCVPLVEAIALAHDCGHGPAGHASEEAFSPFLPDGGYDHAVYGADVTLAPLNLCSETLDGVRNHSWRRPAPRTPEGEVVAWADRIAYVCHDFEDAVRAGILVPDDLPAEVRDVVGTRRSQQIGGFVVAVLDADPPHRVDRDDAARGVARSRRSGRSTSSGSTCDRPQFARPTVRSTCSEASSSTSPMPRAASPRSRQARSRRSRRVHRRPPRRPVRYVSGMTDRFALGLGVELLGWRPDDLPRGV